MDDTCLSKVRALVEDVMMRFYKTEVQPCDRLDLRTNGDELRAKAHAARFKRERESSVWSAALVPPTLLDKWRR
jgi:hypothetical protein